MCFPWDDLVRSFNEKGSKEGEKNEDSKKILESQIEAVSIE